MKLHVPPLSCSRHQSQRAQTRSLWALLHHPTELHGRAHGDSREWASLRSYKDGDTCLQPGGVCALLFTRFPRDLHHPLERLLWGGKKNDFYAAFLQKGNAPGRERITQRIPFVFLSFYFALFFFPRRGSARCASGRRQHPSRAQSTDSAEVLRASRPGGRAVGRRDRTVGGESNYGEAHNLHMWDTSCNISRGGGGGGEERRGEERRGGRVATDFGYRTGQKVSGTSFTTFKKTTIPFSGWLTKYFSLWHVDMIKNCSRISAVMLNIVE